MDKIGERAVIQYLYKKGLTPKDIHNDMVATLGKDDPSYATVKRWVAEFKRGRQSLEDDNPPPPVLKGLSLLLRQKWSIKSMIL